MNVKKQAKRSTLWWIRWPGLANAVTYRFDKPVTIEVAKSHIRAQLKVHFLPRGYEMWMG